jgi:hypothetical protein
MECQLNGKNGYKFGPTGVCYTHDGTEEGRKRARAKATKQGQAIEISKHSDSGPPSYEYLKAVHDRVMAHPHIWQQIKDEIHVQARSSAGGTLKAKKAAESGDVDEDQAFLDAPEPKSENSTKLYNEAPMGSDYYEDDEIIDIPTVFMKAGVFTGSDGVARLKSWDVLKDSAHEFLGRPITDGHIDGWPTPHTPTLGYIKSAEAREKERDIVGISRIFKKNLSPDKLEKLKNGIDGSAGYYTPYNDVSGYHENQLYQSQELGPYLITEYALLWDQKGACSRRAGCGPFQPITEKTLNEENHIDYQKIINSAFAPINARLDKLIKTV